MIPLRDSETARRLKPATSILIVVNVVVFALELKLGSRGSSSLARYAMVPAHVANLRLADQEGALAVLATLITSTFLHAGILHLAGNMLYLFIFGPAVEERFGTSRYVAFYFAAAIAAGLATVAMGPESPVPVIGASGAIAGVLGAYFVIYPRGRITTILPLLVAWPMVEIPAYFYLMFWFAVQLCEGIVSGAQGPLVGGVAWWAHVGGFLFGIATGPLLIHNPIPKRTVTRRPVKSGRAKIVNKRTKR
jgi:membrane associated rhomboid family serine protease